MKCPSRALARRLLYPEAEATMFKTYLTIIIGVGLAFGLGELTALVVN